MDKIELLKAMADKTKFAILDFLLAGEKCVCKIFPRVKKTQSTVSIHLNRLEKTGILTSRREGKFVYYTIKNKKVIEIIKLLKRK
jgi:ArsR family transcriptional regulator